MGRREAWKKIEKKEAVRVTWLCEGGAARKKTKGSNLSQRGGKEDDRTQR